MRIDNLKSVLILAPVRRILRSWPSEVRRELGTILIRLQRGEYVGMPDMRAMPSIYKGAFEIRIKSKEGAFRTFHICSKENSIVVFHAFLKKSQATPHNEINSAKARLSHYLQEKL